MLKKSDRIIYITGNSTDNLCVLKKSDRITYITGNSTDNLCVLKKSDRIIYMTGNSSVKKSDRIGLQPVNLKLMIILTVTAKFGFSPNSEKLSPILNSPWFQLVLKIGQFRKVVNSESIDSDFQQRSLDFVAA